MKIYVAGKITGLDNFKEVFQEAEDTLKAEGYTVMNPAILPPGFTQEECMHVCYAMIDICDGVYMLSNWKDSVGANLEHDYALSHAKDIIYEGKMCIEIQVLYDHM